jgi:hypothetical protein
MFPAYGCDEPGASFKCIEASSAWAKCSPLPGNTCSSNSGARFTDGDGGCERSATDGRAGEDVYKGAGHELDEATLRKSSDSDESAGGDDVTGTSAAL